MNEKRTTGMLGLRLTGLLLVAVTSSFCQPRDVGCWTRIQWGINFNDARGAFQGQVSDPRVANPPEALLVDRFIVTDIQIGRITAEAAIQTEPDSREVVAVRLRATGASASGIARTNTFSALKHLLIVKYGPPQSEDHSPIGNGGIDNRVLWLFPSTSITLRWSEAGNGENGFVIVRYEAIDRKALEAL